MPNSKKKKGSGTAKEESKTQSRVKKKGLRPELWAIVIFFIAFVAFLNFFSVKGFMVDWYRWIVCTLCGYGFYIFPFCLLTVGWIFLVYKRDRNRFQTIAIMVLPFIVGSIRHLITDNAAYVFSAESFKILTQRAQEFMSGGIVSGWFAIFLRLALGQVGAVIILSVLALLCLGFVFSSFFRRLFDKLRRRREENITDWDVSDKPATIEDLKPRPVHRATRSRKSGIDVPLDPAPSYSPVPEFIPDDEPPFPMEDEPPVFEKPKKAAASAVETKHEEVPEEKDEGPSVEELLQSAKEDPLKGYVYPPISLLEPPKIVGGNFQEERERYSRLLVDTLSSFGIEASVTGASHGPTVTRYELALSKGTRYSKVVSLSNDIALALGASGVRISMIPDKNAVGIEVPNDNQQMVSLYELLDDKGFKNHKSKLAFGVGRDISGACVFGDISKLPHLLVAGTTGSGKSVCINSIIISLIYKSSPEEVRFVMVDPKMIELGVYNGIPHLLIPVVTDPKKAAGALNWAVGEMMRRYKLMSEAGARDIDSYNLTAESRGAQKEPRIVIIIDELADLMFVAAREVEESIARIAQMARAAGMHLIIATQRPSADVITGIMKANIPSRIAFAVSSAMESRIILDDMGAEKLIGKGDMIYSPLGCSKPSRVQGSFISTAEVEKVVDFIKQTGTAEYSQDVIDHIEKNMDSDSSGASVGGGDDEDDEKINEAIDIVVESGQASTSMLQRRLKLGYARAARLVDQMEERGIVGPFEGSKPRQVLITKDEWKEMKMRREEF